MLNKQSPGARSLQRLVRRPLGPSKSSLFIMGLNAVSAGIACYLADIATMRIVLLLQVLTIGALCAGRDYWRSRSPNVRLSDGTAGLKQQTNEDKTNG